MTILHRSTPLNSAVDKEKRTFPILFSTGAKVLRKWGETFVYEELDMSRDAIDLSDFNSGTAPLCLDHDTRSVKNIVGVIESGSAYVDGNNGYCMGRFGTDQDSDLIRQKVEDKIVTRTSVGYQIQKVERVRGKDGEYDTIVARKWKPKELSLVVFPADPKSGIRSEEFEDLHFLEGTRMAETTQTASEAAQIDIEAIRKEEREKETKRIKEIRNAVRIAKLDDDFAESLIDSQKDIHKSREEIFIKLSERKEQTPYIPQGSNVTVNPVESISSRNDAISNAILNRFEPEYYKLNESSARFSKMSLHGMIRYVTNADPYDGGQTLAERALSSSDFPILLANVLNKKLRRDYEAAPRTFDPITIKRELSDFKEVLVTQMGDAPVLKEKPEHSEYQQGKFSEAGEKYALKEWGRMISITRRMLINDDLGAMIRIPSMISRRAAELESDLAWGSLINNPMMSDGLPIFDAKHNNYVAKGKGGIFDPTTIAAAKSAMRMQKGLDGGRINLTPKYLIVPAALEGEALKFLFNTTPIKDADVNPFKSTLQLIVEPRLDDVSQKAWYLASDKGLIDLIEMAYLQGQQGLFMESKIDFNTDGIKLKCRMDVNAKVIDYRGFYKNEGV